MSKRVVWIALVVLCSLAGTALAQGEPPAPPAAEPTTAEGAAEEEAPLPWKVGPATLSLGHDLELALPAGYQYLEPAASGKVLESMGSFHNESVLGIVTPTSEAKPYMVVVQFADSGFVKDDEELDADAILETLKEGQARANQERVARGFKALTVDGWAEPPRYEPARHHLVWAVLIHDDEGPSINFPTRILGRRGYVEVNLVVGPEHFEAGKADMPVLLAATTFTAGARYEDYDPSTDRTAEYGLVALVTGGVALKAAKVGILAKLWGVILAGLVAFKKALILVVIGIGVLARKLLGRKKEEVAEVEPSSGGEPPA